MDPATVIALCKENIQPLRHGRNATQLGTALRAQEDSEAQQMLMQEKQMYEDAIKNYDGDDPLENWYEYILWMEQSYPKSGHESHICKVLQDCLGTFEKDTKYAQDRRYIRLWINYISLQKNPLELYQLLYNNGIGTMVADMYRAWAFELEQIEDYKRADQVYLTGMSALAEPREELDFAHKNFQLAIGRRMLGHNDGRSEIPLSEQRQAFSSLRAIKAGRRVTSIRTGHRVREYLPGTVQQSGAANNAARSNSRIQIYQDEPLPGNTKSPSILDHVPIEESVHKENSIKPGPWSNTSRNSRPLMLSTIKPSFKVHEDRTDDDYDLEQVRLFPNHTPFFDGSNYAEHGMIPVFVADAVVSGFTTEPHYPKELVYEKYADRSMEEIRAERYSQRYSKTCGEKSTKTESSSQQHHLSNGDHLGHQVCDSELLEIERREKRKFEQEELAHQEEQQRQREQQRRDEKRVEEEKRREYELQLERQRFEAENLKLEKERREAQQFELEQLEHERQRREAELERQRYEVKQQKAREALRIEAERIEAERIEAQRMEAELHNSQRKLQTSSFLLQRHHTSSGPPESDEHLLGQSLTVNTKEAMSVVQDLWHSPANSSPGLMINRPMLHRMPDSRAKLSFDIHMDSSMTQQHAMSNTKEHPSNSYHIQSYHDQENHQHFHNSYSNQDSQSYATHGIVDPYQYQVTQQHHDHRVQPHIQHPHHHQHHQHPQHQHVQSPQQQHLQSPQQQHLQSPQQQHLQSPQQQHLQSPQQQHLQSPQQQHLQSPQQQHLQSPQQQHLQSPQQHLQSPQQHLQSPQQHLQSPQQQHQHPLMHHHPQQHQPHNPQPHHQSHLSQQTQNSPHQLQVHHSTQSQSIHHHHSLHSRHSQQPHPCALSQGHNLQAASHLQHQQHVYATGLPVTNVQAYHQPYSMPLPCTPGNSTIDDEKQLHFTPYVEADAEDKPYKMPEQLPYIKSPGMNRRDLKYLENADDKENASVAADYNNAVEESKQPENNLYVDDTSGIAPLSGANETCITEAFNAQLPSSTPLTNQFRHTYKPKDATPQYSLQNVPMMPPQRLSDTTTREVDDKLSVILESTREYVSSSSGSSVNTRTTQGFTSTREEQMPIKEQSPIREAESSESLQGINKTYEDQMRAKIQAVHAQSPRTVQRNVDQITSEIKNNCDLRIPFKLNSEPNDEPKPDTMDCEDQEPMEQVEEEEFQLPTGDINPFDKSLIAGLLRNIKFPQPQHSKGYDRLNINLTKIVPSSKITLGSEVYDVEKCLGKGTYGTVVKATDLQSGMVVALKTQKPAWVWEYYIAREIKSRLTNPHMLRGFMDIDKAYVANNGSVLVSQFSKYGTLLAVTNQVKIATGKPLLESLAIYFTIEMLNIVEHLHKCQIIHGDIKPDNFLLMHLPTEDVRPTIQLIDFGCSIDMSLLPEGTQFKQIIKTQDFTCIEMQTGRPWTYQTDLYCVAASSHCLLFGNYMRVSNIGGRWVTNSKLPRYAKKHLWERFFTDLLNIESCDQMPDLSNIRHVMEESLSEVKEFQLTIRQFANVLNNR